MGEDRTPAAPAPGAKTGTTVLQVLTIGLPVLSTIMVALLTVGGSLYAGRVTEKLGELTQSVEQSKVDIARAQADFDQAKTLTQAMRDAIPVVVGRDKARASMTVSTLYFLARGPQAKAEVIQMAAFAQDKTLDRTLLELLQGDAEGKSIAARPEIVGMIAFTQNASAAKTAGADATPKSSVQTELLKTVTLTSAAGWSYLGRGHTSRGAGGQTIVGTFDDDHRIVGTSVPVVGTPFTFRTSVYLRAAAPLTANDLGTIAGVIAGGSRATALELKQYPVTRAGEAAVWARVQFVCDAHAAGHGETSPPVCVGTERVKIFKVADSHSTGIYVRNIGTARVTVSLSPKCADAQACKPLVNAVVPPVKSDDDASNDYKYTADTTAPNLAFDWSLSV